LANAGNEFGYILYIIPNFYQDYNNLNVSGKYQSVDMNMP